MLDLYKSYFVSYIPHRASEAICGTQWDGKEYLRRKNISDNTADLVKCPIGRPIKFSGRKSPEVIAALTISDILESLDSE